MAQNAASPMASAAAYVLGGGLLAAIETRLASQRKPRSPIAPPRAGFGIAWSLLFAGMGIARSRLERAQQRRVDWLWLLCATYPLYTFGNRSRPLSYLGNGAVGAAAARLATVAARHDEPTAAALIGAVVPWVAYATLILLTEKNR